MTLTGLLVLAVVYAVGFVITFVAAARVIVQNGDDPFVALAAAICWPIFAPYWALSCAVEWAYDRVTRRP